MQQARRAAVSLGVFVDLIVCAYDARAQVEPTRGDRVLVEDVLRPRAGRVRVEWTAEPSSRIALGLGEAEGATGPVGALAVGSRVRGRFGAEPTPTRCRAPCAMHLRPGRVRLVADADTPYVWSAEVAVGASGGRFAIRPHRVGLSALGGAMFVLGCALGVLGPGVVVANLWVGDSAVRPASIAGGTLAALAGGGLIAGGWFVVADATPSVTRVAAREGRALVGLRVDPIGASLVGWF
jgi:hypothetical protein